MPIIVEVTLYNRYDKNIIEPFALKTIANSYDKSYEKYIKPNDTDNFDYYSEDSKRFLEISLIITDNERRAYEYDKLWIKNKNPITRGIKNAVFSKDKKLCRYHGGEIQEICNMILERIIEKHKKAINRIKSKNDAIDLCLCINDGGILDFYSFILGFDDFNEYIFDNIFFITRDCFILYNKSIGFKEYPKIICN